MSRDAQKWLVERVGDVPAGAMKALFLLAWHHNGATGQCNPSHELLAKELGCSTRTIRRAVEALRGAELIRTYQRSKGGDRWETMAYILVPNGGTVPKQWRPPGAKRTPARAPDNKLSAGQGSDHRTDSEPSVPATTGQHVGLQTGKNRGVSKAAAEPEAGTGVGAPVPHNNTGAGEGEGEAPSNPPTPTRSLSTEAVPRAAESDPEFGRVLSLHKSLTGQALASAAVSSAYAHFLERRAEGVSVDELERRVHAANQGEAGWCALPDALAGVGE